MLCPDSARAGWSNARQAWLLGALSPCLVLALLCVATSCSTTSSGSGIGVPRLPRQESLDEWRALTGPQAPPPRVYVKGNEIRFRFETTNGLAGFRADWQHARIPSHQYKVKSAVLRWDGDQVSLPSVKHGWTEAVVISAGEWSRLATNLISALVPTEPGHGVIYQAFLVDGVLYRDASGVPRIADDPPAGITVDRRFGVEETLEILARRAGEDLAATYPNKTLFLLMSPNSGRVTHPLLLDRTRRRCVSLTPAAVVDSTDRRLGTVYTPEGLKAFLPESHGWALIKNPVSSAARLADLGIVTIVRFLRLPLPTSKFVPPLAVGRPGMDLHEWEHWLDFYTGTRAEYGQVQLEIDGDQFFGRLTEALASATNRVHMLMYIFDRDDVAVQIAQQLKERAREIEVKVIIDRLGSLGGGVNPPGTPLPEEFIPPNSMLGYLREEPNLKVRPFLNPWFPSEQSKLWMVATNQAWLGG